MGFVQEVKSLMSFELNTTERKGKRAFIPISWQIYTLDKLLIQVKHEFNASNRELYTKEALLAQGRIAQMDRTKSLF